MKNLKLTLLTLFLLPLMAAAQTPLYVITGSGGYATAKKDGNTIGTASTPIQTVIEAIEADASENYEIQFGNGTDTLNIGNSYITLDDSEWDVTLSGKITSMYTMAPKTDPYVIYITGDANVESKADIIDGVGRYAIYNDGNGTLTISEGTISASTSSGHYAVYNGSTGTVIINAGTISSNNYAVYNGSTGTVIINGGTISSNYYAVYNGSTGTVIINDGTISATGSSNYAVYNGSTGTVIINGGTISSNNYAVYNGSDGTVNIYDGIISSIRNNSTGIVNIHGGNISGNAINVIYNISTGTININGGIISATGSGDHAVNNYSDGTVNINGGTISRIYNSGGTLNINDGNISGVNVTSTNYTSSTGGLINISGGTISGNVGYVSTSSGSESAVVLSGSPTIIGTIAAKNLSVVTDGENAFDPGEKIYTINFYTYTLANAAVINGKDFIDNFKVANTSYDLVASYNSNDLLIASSGIGYNFTKNGTTYTITNTLPLSLFNSVYAAINAIKADANGSAVEIQFGNGTDTLDIGAAYITFDGSAPGWNVTLSGKITSSSISSTNCVIYIANDANVESKADIENTYDGSYACAIRNYGGTLTISSGTIISNGTTIQNESTETLTISGGTISTTGTSTPSYAVHNASTGTVNINAGTISATGSYAVRNASTGTVIINDGNISATGSSSHAVYNSSTGTIIINGGNISSPGTYTVYNSSTETAVGIYGGTISSVYGRANIYGGNISKISGTIVLGGSPTIADTIKTQISVVTEGENAFDPGEKIYTFGFNSYTENLIVVTNGKNFVDNFIVANSSYGLAASGNDLVLKAKVNGYIFAKNDTTYTITKAASVSAVSSIQTAIDAIKADANGAAVVIQFGSGTDTLDIGTANITFNNLSPGWNVTLSGKIKSANTSANGIINITDGIVESRADIINTYNGHAIRYDGAGILTISGGNISATGSDRYAVYNASSGTVNINSGTISATGSGSYAVYNASTGSVALGGSPAITGAIRAQNLSVVTEGENAFAPGENIYALDFNSYAANSIAVISGKDFVDNFTVANSSYGLAASGNNIVLKAKVNGYIFAKNNTTYTITKAVSILAADSIQKTINAIKADANGAAVEIQFGDGVEELDIGAERILFNGSAWNVAFSGKITSAASIGKGTIELSGSVNIESAADIKNTADRGDFAITHSGTGTLTINSGTISATIGSGGSATAIYNASIGTITINGGTISAKGGSAVQNYDRGRININGGTLSATGSSPFNYAIISLYDQGSVVLGGSPTITGIIGMAQNLSVVTEGENAFAPGDNVYTIYSMRYTPGTMAVINGKDFVRNFVTMDAATFGGIKAEGNNLVYATAAEASCFLQGDIWENNQCRSKTPEEACIADGKIWENNACWTEAELEEAVCIAESKIWENEQCRAKTLEEICIAEGKTWENDQCTTPIRAPQIAASQIRAQSIPNGIMLQNLPQNAKIEAYNLQGRQVYSTTSHSLLTTSLNIPVSAKGMYIVKISLGSQKHILRIPVR